MSESYKSIRIVIVDDDPSVIEGLTEALMSRPGFVVTGKHLSAKTALLAVASDPVDHVFLDVRMPGMSGPDCAQKLKAVQPHIKILMMSGVGDGNAVLDSFVAGADGFLLKPMTSEECYDAIEQTRLGKLYIPSEVGNRLIHKLRGSASSKPGEEVLTRRETEILSCLYKGMTDKAIAKQLCIATSTVHTHMHQLFKKLGVTTRAEAVQAFLRI